ncbi:MAG: thioredoxin domain-containing protein, partial [Thermoanaerobaculales bacterium]
MHMEAMVDTPRHTNRLAGESSPYLQQHAHNPVGWYPWGDEALSRARTERRPIFLSVGYAACHWCHVMERESFEDPAVATLLNDHFVPIKVDREQRPDLDAVYMTAVQAMTGSGGWPLSVFLTPDLEPFFGGTYFPPERRYGMASFSEILLAVADAWENRRGEVLGSAAALSAQLARIAEHRVGEELNIGDAVPRALASLASRFDEKCGGFDGAPKFPTPSRLFFLVHNSRSEPHARTMLERTLDGMAAGGMHDWLGGGFHRYAVDEQWLVPHFEKMLYDNALLARVYGEAGLALDNPAWLAVARTTADYLLREMRGPQGAFFSSTDADSEGHEGTYFTWTAAQLRQALPRDQADALITLCGLGTAGNFEGEASVLRPQRSVDEVAAELGRPAAAVRAEIVEARATLLAARDRRVSPALDDKFLAGWNGMAVWALAYLGAALPEPRYLAAAKSTATFLLEHRGRDGQLVRSWRNDAAAGVETLEDLAWVTAGLVELYEADGNLAWLEASRALVGSRLQHYQAADGALFDTPDD